MSNEITDPRYGLPATPSLQQTGKNNVHVTNEAGGVVNVNYNTALLFPQVATVLNR